MNQSHSGNSHNVFPLLSADIIRHQLFARLEQALYYLFPKGNIRGELFEIGDVTGNQGRSLKIQLSGHRMGLWYDFATNEGGDIIDLWAARHHLSRDAQFTSVLQSMHTWLNGQTNAVTTTPLTKKLGQCTGRWNYTNSHRKLIAQVYRYETSKGKQYRPWDAASGQYRAPNPRPLYNQPGIMTATQVILVEGEKAADALIKQGIAATTAMQGANAPPSKTDWSPLKGKHLILWPDNDNAGRKYANNVSDYLKDSGLLLSLRILVIPDGKPDKWDAADAVAENINVKTFIDTNTPSQQPMTPLVSAYTMGQLLDDTSPMPTDLIAPRVLTPSGLMVLGGAPKVGKSDFLLSLLSHLAAGQPFLRLRPPRPLKIFYLQTEVGYHYLRERLQQHAFDEKALPLVRKNLVLTPQSNTLLNEQGTDLVKQAIQKHFGDETIDIIAVDPLRNVFDGGEADTSENNNASMLFFLTKRLECLRQAVNPDAGIILAHHTRKIQKKQLGDDPFQALSGASSLRSYYTTGLLLFKENQNQSQRQLLFELRNGSAINGKLIDKTDNGWHEVDTTDNASIRDKHIKKYDDKRKHKNDIILNLICKQALQGHVYTVNQFCHTFEGESGLGGANTIRNRLNVLASKGQILFFKEATMYGIANPTRTKFGFLCVKDMQFCDDKKTLHRIFPTHYRCKKTGNVLPIKDPYTFECND